MGLYYNPIPPHIGAQQPLTPRQLTPPISGPAPQNPPFQGAAIAQAILVAWATSQVAPAPVVARNLTPQPAPAAAPVLKRYDYTVHNAWLPAAPMPQAQTFVDPPISGPPPQNPPFMGGARVPLPVQVAWIPPPHIADPNFAPDTFAPWVVPPVVTPFLPIGTRIPDAVLVSWLPLPPLPQLPINLDPPRSVPQNPPFAGTRVPVEVQVAWIPPPPTPYPQFVAENFAPLLPPPPATYRPIGVSIPTAVMVSWLPPAPMPIVARLRNPPQSGPLPQNPFFPGARVPVAVQVSWLPQPPRPIMPPKLGIATAPVSSVLATTEAADTAQFVVQVRSDAPGILNFGRRVTINRW